MPAEIEIENGAAPVPPKPKTELEAIQMQANQVTDESLESTRRMLAMCEEVNSKSKRKKTFFSNS